MRSEPLHKHKLEQTITDNQLQLAESKTQYLTSAMKAAQALSGEIILATLLPKMMQIVMEYAGAERGVLILDRTGQWMIEVVGQGQSLQITTPNCPLASPNGQAGQDPLLAPATVINYVADTRETVVLDNDHACVEQFAHDPYILAHQPYSLLCMPLIHQGKLIGMVYLEHAQPLYPACLEVLPLLINQAATSIENAYLYSHMETLVEQRTTELTTMNSALQSEIAERTWVDHALRESEAIYRAMFERNHAVKLLINPATGAIIDANPAACAFYGYTLPQLRNKSIADINTLPSDKVKEEMVQAQREQRTYFLFRHQIASGEIRDVEVHSGPIEIHGRNLLFSIIHDVTERVQAERDLQRHDAILEAVSTAAQNFLKTSSFKQEIPIFLELVGIATGVSRVALFTVQRNIQEELIAQQQETWVSAGQKHFFPDSRRLSGNLRQRGTNDRQFPRWHMQLCQGLPLYGNVVTFPNEEQRALGQQHIGSLVVIPVFVEREWWGFIEFDVCQHERSWTVAEVKALEAATSLMSAAIERERFQGILKENEERFRTIVDFTYDWEYWITPHGTFTYVSPACERITGYPPQTFQADPLFLQSIMHPDDNPTGVIPQKPFEMERVGVSSAEFRIITRTGEVRWIGHVSQPVYAADGRWLGQRGSNRDITERVTAEQALRESEERYRAISELVSDYAYALNVAPDGSHDLEWATEAFARTTGFLPEEVAIEAGWWHALVVSDDGELIASHQQRLLQGQMSVSEFRIVTKGQQVRWLREHGQPVWDMDQGCVVRIYGAARDITEQREAQEALRRSHDNLEMRVAQRTAELEETNHLLQVSQETLTEREAMFRGLVESMDDIVFMLDTEQRHTGVFGRWLERYGLSPEHFLGKTSAELQGEAAAVHTAANARVLNGEYIVYEWSSGDPPVTIQTSLSPLYTPAGEVIGIVGVGRDITQLKQAEAELRRLNRSLKTLSDCNQVLVRATDEQTLLYDICRILIELGDYHMVWVGFTHDRHTTTNPQVAQVAQAGCDEDYLQQFQQRIGQAQAGNTTPWNTALQTATPCIQEPRETTDAMYEVWQQDAQQWGYQSLIALPLIAVDHLSTDTFLLGVITIYTQDIQPFDAAEVALLDELANDLVYGITALRTRDEYRRTAARLHNILDIAANAIIAVDSQHGMTLFNPAAELIFGYNRKEVYNKPFESLLAPSHVQVYYDYIQDLATMTREQISGSYIEVIARRRYGSTFPAEISVASAKHDEQTTYTIILRDITAQKQAEEDLLESRNRIASILESITDGFFALDTQWRFIYVNHEAERLLRHSREELWDQDVWETFPEAVETAFYQQYHHVVAEQQSTIFETFYTPWAVWFEVHAYPSRDGLSVYFRDITERKRAEQELRRVNRALKTLSECNKTVVRATREPQLLQNVCENIVQIGGYRMAWVGFAEQSSEPPRVIPVAHAGHEAGYLEKLTIILEDKEYGKGPTGQAIRTGQPCIIRHIRTDPSYTLWRDEALKRGYESSIALPLLTDEQLALYGTLNIYADEPDVFDEAEIALLHEMADDLAYGIAALRLRQQHREAEELVHYQKTQLECQSEAAFDGILVTSREQDILFYNQRFLEMWHLLEADIAQGTLLLDLVTDQLVDPETFVSEITTIYEHPQQTSWQQVALKDGRTFERYTAPVRAEDGTYYGRVWFYRDISQQKQLFNQLRVANERLQKLSRRLVDIQEEERRHIARELHDEIGQALTGLHLLLEMMHRATTLEQVQHKLSDARQLVYDLMTQVREMSLDLRPAMLDDLGLLPTLRWYFNRYTTQTGIHVIFKHTAMEQRFAPEIETVVYRLIQEALTNVARYAQVQEVTVRIWKDPQTLGMHIEDTGVGFDPEAALTTNASSGLAGMYERVGLLGGTLEIESSPGQGTCIVIDLPLLLELDTQEQDGKID